jgi:predicted N-acetyltransferase YhbS
MRRFRYFLRRQVFRIRFLSIRVSKKAIYSNSDNFEYRLFTKKDSIEELTKLINTAYKANAEKGMNFMGATQNVATTLRRIRKSICIIACYENKIIATITFKPPHRTKGSNWFKKPYVAKRNMLAVLPEFQNKGIAKHLIKLTEVIAKLHGAEEIAIDTAEQNKTLFNFYKKNNYRFIEKTNWEKTNYISVIYSKNLM